MKHGSLFSGIGGFDLAAEWMGWENIFHCELNEFGQRVLKHYWPNAKSYSDIKQTDFTIHRGQIDILTGGFPCQPYSTAGRRLGKEDERHLWPEMLRAIREISPRWVVGENVRGLVNWNGGMVFDEVQADLEALGYEVQPFLLPASGVNAPHERYRIWLVAHAKSNGNRGGLQFMEGENGSERQPKEHGKDHNKFRYDGEKRNASNSNSRRQSGKEYGQKESGRLTEKSIPSYWENFPTQSPICTGDDGFPTGLDGITFSKWRNESIKAAGNAVVPELVFQIFKAIEQCKLPIH